MQRHLLRRNAGQILQLAQHGGIIVPQYVQLHQHIVHRTEIEVRGDGIGGHIVRRMLNRRELVDRIFLRQHHHARGMLSRGALYAGDAIGKALLFRVGQGKPALLRVFQHIAVGGLFRHRADRARAEAEFRAEQFLDVIVRHRLIFAGEVQVDIGHLVALEAEEYLERDVETVAPHFGSANRTLFGRQIQTRGVARGNIEFIMLALRADVVRRKRIDLRNTGQERHEG